MPQLLPDQSFYPSPTMAMKAPPETLGLCGPAQPGSDRQRRAGRRSISTPPRPRYGASIARVDMPGAGDELHHFGWNACSSCLCPYSPHPHMQRRYLVVPGMRSSRIHILDTQPDPRKPAAGQGHRRRRGDRARPATAGPHTAHCGPDGIYINALGDRTATAPAASSSSIRRRSRSRGAGSATAGRSTSPTTSGGTSATTR